MKEYEGLLKEPLTHIDYFLNTDVENEEFDNLVMDKLALLFEHFEIQMGEENAYMKLALSLAKAHVPGFQPPKRKPGRPGKNQEEIVIFLMAIELLIIRDDLSKRAAVQTVIDANCFEGNFSKWWKIYQQANNGQKLKGGYAALMRTLENARNNIPKPQYVSALEYGLGEDLIKKLGN